MIPREGVLAALARFCIKYSQQGKIGTFTTDHIMKMARSILDNNCFAYNNKYYKQVRGGAMGLAFTQVLANIYMLEWEQDLIQHQTMHHEIYGRLVNYLLYNLECTRIDMSLPSNNYPPQYITKQFHRFFQINNAMSVLNQLNKEVYSRLHHNLLYQPTHHEKLLQTMLQDPIRTPAVLQPKIWNKETMFPRYLFDSALTPHFRKKFIGWWKKYYAFPGSPVQQVQVRLVANTNRTLEHFFIHKKPSPEVLTKMKA